MRKKICLGCGLGCGTILLLLIMGFLLLNLLVSMPPDIHIETEAVSYIIEHMDEFKDEFREIGYEARVAYTLGERNKQYHSVDTKLQEKMGYQGRGILILEKENEEYVFDIGFDYCNLSREDYKLHIGKEYYHKDEVLKSKGVTSAYPVHVSVSNDAILKRFGAAARNDYNIDFTKPDKIGMHGAEMKYDYQIKKHISAEELREIYERCIGLQEKLVELYKAKRE